MATMSTTFAAEGNGNSILVKPGNSISHSYVVAGGETFNGTLSLQKTPKPERGFDAISTTTGDHTAGTTSGTWVNESAEEMHVRWAVTAFTAETDDVVCAVSDVGDDIVKDAQLRQGKVISGAGETLAEFREDGIYSGAAGAGNFTTSLIVLKKLTFSTQGPTDDVDVTGVSVLECYTADNYVIIGGFVGGVQGQFLYFVNIGDPGTGIRLENEEGGGEQDIYLRQGQDIDILNNGGCLLYCDGTSRIEVGNSTLDT